jgi:hypothetical protein
LRETESTSSENTYLDGLLTCGIGSISVGMRWPLFC